jgi:hypothetical protein
LLILLYFLAQNSYESFLIFLKVDAPGVLKLMKSFAELTSVLLEACILKLRARDSVGQHFTLIAAGEYGENEKSRQSQKLAHSLGAQFKSHFLWKVEEGIEGSKAAFPYPSLGSLSHPAAA